MGNDVKLTENDAKMVEKWPKNDLRSSRPKVTSLVTDGHAFAKYLSDKDIKLTLTIVNCLQIKAMGHFWATLT